MLVLTGGNLQGAACTLLNFFIGDMRKKKDGFSWQLLGVTAAFVYGQTKRI